MGNKEQERRILEHILTQAHQQQNSYLFLVACLNYLALPLVNQDCKSLTGNGTFPLPVKVRDVLKALSIPYTGPIWNLVLKAALQIIEKGAGLQDLGSPLDCRQFLPHLRLREAKNWSVIGFKTLSEV